MFVRIARVIEGWDGIIEQCRELLAKLACPPLPDAGLGKMQCLGESLVAEGLEQVVEGMDLERAERVLVVRGHKDDDRCVHNAPASSQLCQRAEAI